MNTQLHRTAQMINSGIGAETLWFAPDTQAAIEAIDPRTLTRTIPAGMPGNLQQQVYLLFSNLASRRAAFNPILEYGTSPPLPRSSVEAARVLEGLSHGTAPAARFSADLAAARALASSRPSIPAVAPDSRASAEVAVHTEYILSRNGGCGASGGWLETTPAPIVWTQGTSGTIGGTGFQATYQPGQGWRVSLNAC